eukprot:TRINITY_DN141_c0_g1_i1.p1 TRINITY_DN141_c0_g1~~TRINITY_DN141_c0_g1_i1.p1  ORF type:complete len:610 (+),score=64.06 TRINITY_DN141_c0_g1_i1:2749-4578(+)
MGFSRVVQYHRSSSTRSSLFTKKCTANPRNAHPVSYADDLNFTSATSEAAVQRSVNLLGTLCKLTGMTIHPKKTKSFGTKPKYCGNVQLHGETFDTSCKLQILVVLVYFQPCRRENTRARKAIAEIERLAATRLYHNRKVQIIAENILPSAFYGVLFDPIPDSWLVKMKKQITSCIWGARNPMRSASALLGIAYKGHTLDPYSSVVYKAISTLGRLCTRQSNKSLFVSGWETYKYAKERDGTPSLSKGPFGNAEIWLREIGTRWKDFVKELPRGMPHLKHEVRARLKEKLRGELAEERDTFKGIETGVDERKTNVLHNEVAITNPQKARRILCAVTGAILPLHPRAYGDMDGTRTKCLGCDAPFDIRGGTSDLLQHTIWHCPAHTGFRTANADREWLVQEHINWPICTRVHGIITSDLDISLSRVKELHLMLAEVAGKLENLHADKQVRYSKQHFWNRPFRPGNLLTPKPLPWYHEHGLQKKYFPGLIPFVLNWLNALKWGEEGGQVSKAELAVDLIATERLHMGGEDIACWARKLGRILSVLERSHAVTGYSTRPIFASPKVTHSILEEQMRTHCILNNSLVGFTPKLLMRYYDGPKALPRQKGSNTR